MGSKVCCRFELRVGEPTDVYCKSPTGRFGVNFEDDGEVGYFYGYDYQQGDDPPFLDALHIYNVAAFSDNHTPSVVEIVWSDDGLKSVLVINRYPHAVFDFESKRAFCRTNFGAPVGGFTDSHEWDDNFLELFK